MRSVAAALLTSEWLADALVDRLRLRIVDERGAEEYLPPGVFNRTRHLEPHDLALLVLCAFAIEDGPGLLGGSLSVDRGFRELNDVKGSLRRLSLGGLIEATSEGEFIWRVSWGERALGIGREAASGL